MLAVNKNKFRIVQISPVEYIHSQCFDEVVLLLKYAFESLGIDCDLSKNIFDENKINIVVGSNLLKYSDSLKNFIYIPFQLEQISKNSPWFNENFIKIMQNAYEVWDYSIENVNTLQKFSVKAKYLPLGYNERLERIKHLKINDKNIDILFYGSVNERRKKVLDELNNFNVKILFGVYGAERDAYIAKSKILINIHYYETKIFESVRISYLLNNRCFIISEESIENPYKDIDLVVAPYEKIVEFCRFYLSRADLIEKKRNENYEQFKTKYYMSNFLNQLLADIKI